MQRKGGHGSRRKLTWRAHQQAGGCLIRRRSSDCDRVRRHRSEEEAQKHQRPPWSKRGKQCPLSVFTMTLTGRESTGAEKGIGCTTSNRIPTSRSSPNRSSRCARKPFVTIGSNRNFPAWRSPSEFFACVSLTRRATKKFLNLWDYHPAGLPAYRGGSA